MRKAKFPARPELLSDVPQEQLQPDFVCGQDQLFEEVVQGERDEAEEEDTDSLTVVEAGEEEQQDDEEPPALSFETPAKMPAKTKFPSVAVPNKQSGQCEVSWEALRPIFAFIDVEDPSMKRRKARQTRRGITIRVDIPTGIAISSFMPEISSDGTTIVFSGYLEQSRCDPGYTTGELYRYGEGVALGMTTALQEYWTHVIEKSKKSSEGGDPKEYKEYCLKLPEPCERDLRDPCNAWEVNDVNELGIAIINKNIRSDFYFLSLFTEASKNFTPAMASRKTLSHMEEVTRDNPMNSTNLAKFAYENRYQIDGDGKNNAPSSRRKKDRRRSKSRHRRHRRSRSRSPDLSRSFNRMSISTEDRHSDSTISDRDENRSRRSGRSRRSYSNTNRGSKTHRSSSSNHYDETESQQRHRVKGKQRKLLEIFQEEIDKELDGMTKAEIEAREEDLIQQEKKRTERAARQAKLNAEELRAQETRIAWEDAERRRKGVPSEVSVDQNKPPQDDYSKGSRSGRSDDEKSVRTRRTRRSKASDNR